MQQEWRTSPTGSGGIAVRRGAAVALIREDDQMDEGVVSALIAAVDAAAEDLAPGRRLARRVAGIVSQADPDEVPDMCLLAATDDGVAAFLVGDVELTVDTGTGVQERLAGQDVSTWVDRILHPPLHRLAATLGCATGGANGRIRSDLREGIVPAGSLVLEVAAGAAGADRTSSPSDEPAAGGAGGQASPAVPAAEAAPVPEPATAVASAPLPAAAPVPPPPAAAPAAAHAASAPDLEDATVLTAVEPHAAPLPTVPKQSNPEATPDPVMPRVAEGSSRGTFVSVSLAEPLPAEELVPLPVDEEPAAEEGVQVLGINCSRGHFNDPSSVYCASCGISLVHQTHNLVPGPRSALGVLVVDDGGVFTLNHDYVLGREPENAEAVRTAAALPLTLEDPERTLSRVHAAVLLQDWNVRVVDLASANGTFVAKHGSDEWVQLVPDEPVTLQPGARIRVGNRILEYDSHRKS